MPRGLALRIIYLNGLYHSEKELCIVVGNNIFFYF